MKPTYAVILLIMGLLGTLVLVLPKGETTLSVEGEFHSSFPYGAVGTQDDQPAEIRTTSFRQDPTASSGETTPERPPNSGLMVTVVDDQGAAIIGSGVAVQNWSRRECPPLLGVTDAMGQVRLRDMAPGAYGIHVDRGAYRFVSFSTPTSLTIALPAGDVRNGRVIDPDGRPIAGADIWVANLGFPQFGQVVTRSDARGGFRLAHVTHHPLLLAARHRDFRDGPLTDTQQSGPLTLRLESEAASLHGQVRSDEGQPIGGAQISFITGWNSDDGQPILPPTTRSVSDGTFSISAPPSDTRCTLLVSHDDWPDTVVDAPTDGTQIDIRLTAGGALRVFTCGADDAPIVAHVVVRPKAPRRERAGATNEEGSATMECLSTGEALVIARSNDGRVAQRSVVIPDGGVAELVLRLVDPPKIEGTLVGPNSIPAPGWRITAQRLFASSGEGARDVSDDEGGFAISVANDHLHELKATSPDGRWAIALGSARASEVGLRFNVPHTHGVVEGRVLDASGRPTVRRIALVALDSGRGALNAVGDDGSFVFDGLLIGRYRLEVRGSHMIPLMDIEVTSEAPVSLGTLLTPELGRLVANVANAPEKVLAQLLVGTHAHPMIWKNGIAVAENVPPGSHVLVLMADGHATLRVPVTIQAGAATCLDVAWQGGALVNLAFPWTPPDLAAHTIHVQIRDAQSTLVDALELLWSAAMDEAATATLVLTPGSFEVTARTDDGAIGIARLVVDTNVASTSLMVALQ